MCTHQNQLLEWMLASAQSIQKHLQWMMEGPDLSYPIHICWKVDSEARTELPVQTEYFPAEETMILIFTVLGARAVISLCILPEMLDTW